MGLREVSWGCSEVFRGLRKVGWGLKNVGLGLRVRCSKFPPCVPIVDGGSLVTVWDGVRREPASESLWDEPNQYKNSAKLAKMAQNGCNPEL